MAAGGKLLTVRVPTEIGAWLDSQAQRERRTGASQVLYTLETALMDWPVLHERAFARAQTVDFASGDIAPSASKEERGFTVKFPTPLIDIVTRMAAYERRSLNAQIVYMIEQAIESWSFLIGRLAEHRTSVEP